MNDYTIKTFHKTVPSTILKSSISLLKYNLSTMNVKMIEKMTRFSTIENKLTLDLGLDSNECIEISNNGYRKIDQPDIILKRNDKFLKIDNIEFNCSGYNNIDKFFDILGIKDKYDRTFLLLTAMSYLFNEVSSPSKSGLILNKNMSDLYLNLSKYGVAFIDNFGNVNSEIQNSFCLAYSDASYSARKLFSNGETYTMQVKCTLILCSISIPKAIQPDFVSRTAFFYIEKQSNIIAEEDLQSMLIKIIPFVRGEILNLASQVMKIKDQFKPSNKTRYTDFDKLAYAACQVLFNDSDFYNKVLDDRFDKNEKCLFGITPEITEFIKIIKDKKYFAYTTAELKNELIKISNIESINDIHTNILSSNIKKYKNYLEDKHGIYVFEGKKISNHSINGIPYFAYTKEFINENSIDIIKISENQSMVNSFYNQKINNLTNEAIDLLLK